jgi:formate dehydrogenase subunit gamma
MLRSLLASTAIALCLCGSAWAQAPAPAAATPPAATGGIQSANIFDIKPDASADPNYAKQSNGERANVQPGNNAPMWRQVGAGETAHAYSSLPKREAPEAAVLVQPFVQYPGSSMTNGGEAWRQVRNNWILPYGGALLFIAVLALALFYFAKGSIKLHGAETGRKIERFTYVERAAHWTNAVAFCVLAVSGLVMAFGKFILLPVLGSNLFGWLTYALKNLHNFVGPLFAVSLALVFFVFLRDNWPKSYDFTWIFKAGGLLGGKEVPSHRFNAGEKIVFWGGVFFLGIVVVASGLVLNQLVPGIDYVRSNMQIANMVHGVATVLMMAMFIGHIYMGTVGMQGAYQAMKTGQVDETWAREHHELWYDDIQAGKIPAQRTPASGGDGRPVQV